LDAAERALFVQLVETNPHLDIGDIEVVADLVQAMIKARKLARKTDAKSVKSWEITQRVVLSTLTKLRLTPQATVHPEKAGRARANAKPPPQSWEDEVETYSADEIAYGDDDDAAAG